MFYYLDRIVVTETNPQTNEVNDLIIWYNPRSVKKDAKYSTQNIKAWKSIYESSNLLVVNSEEEGRETAVKDILKDKNYREFPGVQ